MRALGRGDRRDHDGKDRDSGRRVARSLALPTATPITFPTPLPTPTPIALPTPLPTATPVTFPTPLPTPTAIVLPTPLPTPTPLAFPTPLPTATPVTFPTPLPTATPLAVIPDEGPDASALYQQVAGSVVYIETPDGIGTGWVVRDGLIVTNQHVVNGQDAVTVRHAFLPPFRAEVLFTDAVIDVAFISYNTATTTLEPLEMRVVTADNLGETLLVLGYSGVGVQEDGTVGGAAIKRGVLSQIVSFGEQGGRRLRIDAAVDPGDSGGPVLDTAGRVVGMSKGVVEVDETGHGASWASSTPCTPRRSRRCWRSSRGRLLQHDVAAGAAALAHQPHALEADGPVDGLAHVVDGEGGDADRGHGLHLHAGLRGGGDGGGDVHGGGGLVRLEVDGDAGQGDGVAEGDERRRLLGGHDACDAGRREGIALLKLAGDDERERLRLHDDAADGSRLAAGGGLGADVDHVGVAGGVEVREGRVGAGGGVGAMRF